MEENTFLDQNPQFSMVENQNLPLQDEAIAHRKYIQARNSEIEAGAISRWFNPGITEAAQFDRENYFMDKENAFNEYMFNKTNEYNSEVAKMERAKEAGINLNLMAAGIAGVGGNQAQPMQGASGQVQQNQNAVNPIETAATLFNGLKTGIEGVNTLGEIFGFGEKNKAEIKLIKTNAGKAAEELKYTKQQRKQLEGIGQILIDNAKKEGQQIDKQIEQINELIKTYNAQIENIKADTDLKNAQTGTELEKKKTQEYENFRLEFEKQFREMFGMELTHGEMQLLIEACLNGHGNEIVNYFTDTIAGVLKGIKEKATNGNNGKNWFEINDEIANDIIRKTAIHGKNFIDGYGKGQSLAKMYKEYKQKGGKMRAIEFYNYMKTRAKW